jgi:DNA ligase-1
VRTLYSLRSDGKTQEWTIEVQGSKFRVHSGISGGRIVTAKWTECYGKNIGRANETTPEAQALSEAKSKWDKQIAEGYSENAATAGAKYFEPMLAKDYKKYADKIKFPVYSDRKYDGIRCVMSTGGAFSRNGKPFVTVPHILEVLRPVFAKHPKIILDGELYIDAAVPNFNTIVSLVKRPNPSIEDLIRAKTIEYHIYDYWLTGKEVFSLRKQFMDSELKGLAGVKIVEHKLVNTQAELDTEYELYLSEGYEGQIIRLDGVYENKRSGNLLKRKEFVTDEYKILDLTEGTGNRSGGVGYATLANKDGSTFKSSFKGSVEFLAQVLKDKQKIVGQMATVKFFALTPDGVPRFPYIIIIRNYE